MADGLPLLMDRADTRVRQERAMQGRRQELSATAEAARDALRDIEREQAEAAEQEVRWREEWRAALERL